MAHTCITPPRWFNESTICTILVNNQYYCVKIFSTRNWSGLNNLHKIYSVPKATDHWFSIVLTRLVDGLQASVTKSCHLRGSAILWSAMHIYCGKLYDFYDELISFFNYCMVVWKTRSLRLSEWSLTTIETKQKQKIFSVDDFLEWVENTGENGVEQYFVY